MSSEVLFEGAQKAAVTHDKGPMLVLAGPGSDIYHNPPD